MRSIFALCIAAAFLLAIPATASAESWDDDGSYSKDSWPLQLAKRPVVLASGMLEIAGDTLRVNLSEDFVADPISLAPSIFYGVNKKLTVGISHDRGICVSGDLCNDKVYNDLALLANYSLMGRGNFHVAGVGGLALPSLSDPTAVGMNAGITTKIMAGKVAIVVSPVIYVGFTERDAVDDIVDVPVSLQIQINNQTAVTVDSGIAGPLSGFGDAYAVPVGLSALFSASEKLDFGASFRFSNLGGTDGDEKAREVIGRVALRL